jgi:hypothetical protein
VERAVGAFVGPAEVSRAAGAERDSPRRSGEPGEKRLRRAPADATRGGAEASDAKALAGGVHEVVDVLAVDFQRVALERHGEPARFAAESAVVARGRVSRRSVETRALFVVERHREAPQGNLEESIAEEFGITESAVYKAIERYKARVEKRWAETTGGLVALALALFFWRVQTDNRPAIDVAVNDKPLPVLAPALEPSEVRSYALNLCDRGEYQGCLDLLDRAERRDPDGDKAAARRDRRRSGSNRPHVGRDGRSHFDTYGEVPMTDAKAGAHP